MLLVGSDDGVYRIDRFGEPGSSRATKTLDSGRVYRLRQVGAVPGVFACSRTGLFHSPDGEAWTELSVPQPSVYAVGESLAGDRLYAGTRPAAVYVADATDWTGPAGVEWRELTGFQDLPSRDEWRLPRHENLAQVRDVCPDPGTADRVVAAVEVGGVHVSEDGGETWTERRDGAHDDVHELAVLGPDAYLAATGTGLYRTGDAGRTWERLDEAVDQSYFRRAFSHDGVAYAAGALSNSSTWEDDDADPQLFAVRGDALEPVDLPREGETVTGMAAADGDLIVATHRGSLFVDRVDGLEEAGRFPVPGDLVGRYTPVAWLAD